MRYDKAQLEYAMAGGKFYCLTAGYAMGCAAVKDGKDGVDGTNGTGIAKTEINANGELLITYTSGEGEDSRDWTVFATDTGTCTYLYAFCEAPEAAEDMEEIYQSIFAQLHWSDAE